MSMYNKIFTKILDSSIWLEPSPTRIVWMTLIAAMDEDGFASFASVSNLGHRARVTPDEAQGAVETLEGPDPNSADPDNEGRRIERVPGGWMILNAPKYRTMVTRAVIKEQTRRRVAKFRGRNAPVTQCNAGVTPSVSVSDSDTKADSEALRPPPPPNGAGYSPAFETFWEAYPKKLAKGAAWKAWKKASPPPDLQAALRVLSAQRQSLAWTKDAGQFIPHPATWITARRWEDDTAPPKTAPAKKDFSDWFPDRKK